MSFSHKKKIIINICNNKSNKNSAVALNNKSESLVNTKKKQSILVYVSIVLLTMLSITSKSAIALKNTCMLNNANKKAVKQFSSLHTSNRVDIINNRQFSTCLLSSLNTDNNDNKKLLLKKKNSLLIRSIKTAKIATDLKSEKNVNTQTPTELDIQMIKENEERELEDYKRSVSRIPTSIKVKKTTPVVVATDTESNDTDDEDTETSDDFQPGESELTAHTTGLAFNSLDVSENTKKAISEVMKYK